MSGEIHIITGLNDGGAEAVLYRLCTNSRSCNPHVVSLMDEGKYGPMLREHGVRVTCLGMPRGRVTLIGLWRLWCLLRLERPAVVQTWMYHADLIGGVLAKLAGAKRIFWGIRNNSLERVYTSRSTIFVARLCAILSKWIPTEIICCAHEAKVAHQGIGYCARKIYVIPNGFDLDRFDINDESRVELRRFFGWDGVNVLGMVGRFDLVKHHENLLHALALLKNRGCPFHCVLIGSGMDQTNTILAAWLDSYGVRSEVSLLGQRTDIPEIMNALDIHVLSSRSEAFPNVLAEAMACGTPCVSTDVGDAALIIGETGWLVPPEDPEELADALQHALAESNDERSARGRRARQRITEYFSLEAMVEAYHDVWIGDGSRRSACVE